MIFFYYILYNYFDVSNILSSSQFGFRSGASTEHALLKFSDDILKLFYQEKVAIATFMDLSKAFDCVDHNILSSKLKRYGIHETAFQSINSYLSDREHFVSWNQAHSCFSKYKHRFSGPYCFWSTLTILLIPVISCHSFSLRMTPQYMLNKIQLMEQFKSFTRNLLK